MKSRILLSLGIAIIFCICFNTRVLAQGQGNPQGLWSAEGQNIVKTSRFVRINNSMHILRDAYIDSLLTAFSIQASYLTTVNLLVTGISQFNGLVNFGNTITIDGIDNTISSSTGKIDFLNSNLFTFGNIQADTVKAQVAQFFQSSNITGTLNVQGEFHLLGSAYIDSILTALSIKTNYLETENIQINQISQFNGLVNINSNLISTGDITSSTINTDTVKAQVAQFSKSSNITGTLNVQGESHLLGNAYIDSLLTALSIKTNYLETENILINQISQFNGLVNINSNLISTGDITSSTINTDTVKAQVGLFSKSTTINGTLTADTIQSSVINGSAIFQNGSPILSSQWNSSDTNIYFTGGNVGINQPNPGFTLDVAGDGSFNGSLFTKNLLVEKSISIGSFRFINGAIQPGQKDTIRSSAEIVIISDANNIQFASDTVIAKGRFGIGVLKPEASLDVSGDAIIRGWLYVQDGVVIGKRFEGQKAIIDSIRSERMESKNIQAVTVKTQTLEADTSKIAVTETDTLTAEKIKAGTIVIDGQNNTISCESINANSISLIDGTFDSLNIIQQLKIGNSIYISGIIGASNTIYGTDKVISFLGGNPSLLLYGETRNIKIGIGTNDPQKALHVRTVHPHIITPPLDSVPDDGPDVEPIDPLRGSIRIEDYDPNSGSSSVWDLEPEIGTTNKFHIGTPDNPVMTLTDTGNVSFSGLSGTGTRMVVTDEQGYLSAENLYLASDNLGNHTATQNLKLNGFWLSGDGDNEGISVDNHGEVGVGTTDPQKMLHVKSIHGLTVGVPQEGSLRLEDEYYVPEDGSYKGTSIWDFSPEITDVSPYSSLLNIGTPDNPVMTLTEEGNVGIGTTSPSAKLQINGTFDVINPGATPSGIRSGAFANSGRVWIEYGNSLAPDIELLAPNIILTDFDDPPRITFRQAGTGDEAIPQYKIWIGMARGLSNDLAIMGGNVGIGTPSPDYKLTVNSYIKSATSGEAGFIWGNPDNLWNLYKPSESTDLRLLNYGGAGTVMTFQSGTGNVGIGTTDIPAGCKLSVNGNIWAKEVKVRQINPYGDFVFKDDYKLRTLTEVEDHIKAYGHLPGVPSEDEIKTQDGINLGNFVVILLQKVEELTLYTIEQDKQIKELKKENKVLNKKFKKLMKK